MQSRWRGLAAATMLSLATALTSCGQSPPVRVIPTEGPLALRLIPPEGQVSRYAYSMETSVDSPMMPSDGPLVTMHWLQTQTVLSVEGDVIRVRGAVDSVSMDMGMNMPGMDLLPDLTEMSFTSEMDPRGRVLRIIESEGAPDVPGMSIESLVEGASYFVLPEEEVDTGDTWTFETPVDLALGPGGVSMDMAFTYTFVGLEDGLATLSFEGPMEMNMEMEGMAMGGSGTITGTMVVDLVEGRHVSQTSRMDAEMTIAGMTMKMNSTTTLELMPDS